MYEWIIADRMSSTKSTVKMYEQFSRRHQGVVEHLSVLYNFLDLAGLSADCSAINLAELSGLDAAHFRPAAKHFRRMLGSVSYLGWTPLLD